MATVPKSISAVDEIQFPDEIWTKIISHVPMAQWANFELVNKAFQRYVFGLWKALRSIRFDEDLAIDCHKIRENAFDGKSKVFEKLLLRAPNIRSMSGFTIFTNTTELPLADGDFLQKLSEFKYLDSIDFTNVSITPAQLADFLEIPAIRRRLKNLKLLNCLPRTDYPRDLPNEDQILSRAFGDIPDLSPLRLERFEFGGRSECFGFFQTMNVSNLTTLNIIGARCQPDQATLLIRRFSIHLRHFECIFCFNLGDYQRNLFLAIASCKNLASLKLKTHFSTGAVHSEIADWIVQLGQSGRLVEFSFLDLELINDDVITAIGRYLQNLTSLELDVDKCSPAKLTYLVSKMVGLKKLGLYSLSHFDRHVISQDVVKMIAKSLFNLEYLHLMDPPIYSNMKIDLARMSKLKELSLEIMTNQNLVVWIGVFGLNLESLALKCFNDNKFQDVLLLLLKQTPNLRRLSLRNCRIDNDCTIPIASLCPKLEELDISACRDITFLGHQALIDGCPNLKRLISSKIQDSFGRLTFGKNRCVSLIQPLY